MYVSVVQPAATSVTAELLVASASAGTTTFSAMLPVTTRAASILTTVSSSLAAPTLRVGLEVVEDRFFIAAAALLTLLAHAACRSPFPRGHAARGGAAASQLALQRLLGHSR